MIRRDLSAVCFVAVSFATLPLQAGSLLVAGSIESQSVGFVFPDGSLQATAANDPRIAIAAVPATISEPGSYFFDGNLVASGAGVAITIDADDVTLDLMGFVLDGTGSSDSGIVIATDRSEVEIRNGTVRGFGDHGIETMGGAHTGLRISHIRAIANGGNGIRLSGSSISGGHRIRDCSAIDNGGRGVSVFRGEVVGVIAKGNGEIGIAASGTSAVLDSLVESNGDEGITISTGSSARGNTVSGNQKSGIAGGGAGTAILDNALSGNNASNSATAGSIKITSGSLVRGNTVYLAAATGNHFGVMVTGERNVLEQNVITGHDSAFFFETTAGNNLTVRNYLSGNTVISTNNGIGTIASVDNVAF